MFYLVRLDRDADGNLVETPLPDCGTYEKGADAAKASKTVAAHSGLKVQCRRIAQAGDWRAAMQKRFESGELLPLPEKWDLDPIKDHFVHLAKSDTSLIGYIESNENGIINKPTITTPGRYLTKFYPEVDDDRRRHLIAAIDPSGEIYFATTEQDIEYVYREGPDSCMSGKHDFDDLPTWPSAPYAGGDLAVAYTKNKDGRIQSRALCWPEKKLFGRVYGDFQRMKAALEAEGYTWIRDDNTVHGNKKLQVFIGAKLLKIPTENCEDEYVMPYFDDIKIAIDKGDHFITAEAAEPGDFWVNSGSSDDGVATMHCFCPRKKEPTKLTDMRFVHGAEEEWSLEAIRYEAFVCRGTMKHWSNDFKIVMGDGRFWSKAHFEEHGEYCTVSRKNWPKSEMVQKGDVRMHKSVADRWDDEGKELLEAKPEPNWMRPLRDDPFATVPITRPNFRDTVSATELVLNRSRRVA